MSKLQPQPEPYRKIEEFQYEPELHQPKLVQENILEVKPEQIVAERPFQTREMIAMGVGAGALAVGIPVLGYLGYKVIRKIGENIFGQKDDDEEEFKKFH